MPETSDVVAIDAADGDAWKLPEKALECSNGLLERSLLMTDEVTLWIP